MILSSDQVFSEAELRTALDAGCFELHYQPQFASRTAEIVGVEGLARLRGPKGDLIPPKAFIAALEGMDLIHDLGTCLFARGCADALLWPGLTVAVNVSPAQFRDPNLAKRLIEIARKAGVDPRAMEIEITEGLFFEDPDRAERALLTLSEFGFGIALDDFGTGYSSLSYLLRFPVSKIKIDRSFVTEVPGSMRSATIVHALVALGRALGLKVVAEGVETEEQRMFLRTAGCHLLQGHLLADALKPDQFTTLLERHRSLPVTGSVG